MFSIGFISLLHIILNRMMINFPAWENAQISAPKVKTLCDPGTYHSNLTTTAYCQDSEGNTQRSIQCILCPENMFSSEPNQDHCQACDYGTYAPVGSSACISCYNTSYLSNPTVCANYIENQYISKRKTFLAIFIPIGVIVISAILASLIWYLKKRWVRQRALGSDETWLFNFDDLVKPPTNNSNETGDDTLMREQQKDILTGANGRILFGGSSSRPESIELRRRSSTPIIEEEWNVGTLTSAENDTHHSAFSLNRKSTRASITPSSLTAADNSNSNINRSNPRISSDLAILETEGKSSLDAGTRHKRLSSRGIEGYKLYHIEKPKLIHALGFQWVSFSFFTKYELIISLIVVIYLFISNKLATRKSELTPKFERRCP
jgi:hypothetical protein